MSEDLEVPVLTSEQAPEETPEETQAREEAEAAELMARLTEINKQATPLDMREPEFFPMNVGPTLQGELSKAGFGNRGIAVESGGVRLPFGLTSAERDSVVDVLGSHDPDKPIETVTVVTKFDFWDRMTEEECTAAEEAIAAQSAKKRRTFETAQTLRSDNELWGLLVQLTEGLFGKPRAAQILKASL